MVERVTSKLVGLDIRFAVIGAAAMAVHGVARSTLDLDLLVTDPRSLADETWKGFATETNPVGVDIRRGDAEDPLAGVVRVEMTGERNVDLVVGKYRWQEEILVRSERRTVAGIEIPVASLPDLVLLKLFAAGSQDAWDVEQLLAGPDEAALRSAVESRLGPLPHHSREIWERITSQRSGG